MMQTEAPGLAQRSLDCRLIDSLDQLQRYEREWDRLAVACGKPTCRPAWLRAWWDAWCIPADRASRALRVVVVTEGERLLALFPGFFIDRQARFPDLHLLGAANFWSAEPLVSDEAPPETFALFARALGESSPPPATTRTAVGLGASRHGRRSCGVNGPGGLHCCAARSEPSCSWSMAQCPLKLGSLVCRGTGAQSFCVSSDGERSRPRSSLYRYPERGSHPMSRSALPPRSH